MASRESRLAGALVELADTLVADFDVVDLLQRLVDDAVDLLGASQAGLLLGDQRGGIRVLASTTENARLLELFQVQNDEGPCLDCIRGGTAVLVPDLAAAAGRWPRFVPAALEQGLRSVHTVPLRLRSDVIGALGLFHSVAGPLDRRGPAGRSGAGRHRHHRHPPAADDRRRRGAGRAAADGPEQPGRHRAGQGRAGRDRRHRHGHGVTPPAGVLPRPQPAAHRGLDPARRPPAPGRGRPRRLTSYIVRCTLYGVHR